MFDRYEGDEDRELAHERRVTRCKSTGCREQIVWLRTANGREMPCDSHSVSPEDELYEHGRHISHWATCKSAEQFRRK